MNFPICVYCSSSNHVNEIYAQAARQLGEWLALSGHPLVYGGGNIGLMGKLATAVHAHRGRVIGVIPQSMIEHEIAYHQADQLITTDTMRQRKQLMEDHAQAFIALPGGLGTLEELSEIITHRQLKYHNKPIVIINTQGFYDPLLNPVRPTVCCGQ